ncbi:glycosyltransferase family 1 protein [Georgenia halophila]|uniref:Glycosyltransferase family 1 protein n=1 Tax=Georgenia halophila TaxID=620889 RepID=A0ABP8LD29_9MICO
MRIAMISEHASPLAALGGVDAGGQNVYIAALALELADQGHDVVVYTRRDDADLADRVRTHAGVDVVHVPAGPATALPKDELAPYMPAFGRWLARDWLSHGRPDVVHSHFWMSGLAALEATQHVPVPVVHTYHALGTVKRRHQGSADTSPPGRIRAERRIGRSVDLVVATCRDEVDELRRMGVPPDTVRVVPCGVDVGRFTDQPSDDGHDPAGARNRPHRLLSVSRLVPRKGIDTVVEALAQLPTAELLIGGGPPADRVDDEPEIRRLRDVARQHGVADRVRFLGSVDRGDMPALIRASDVVVTTPWYEPFGMVPLEAAACGRPLVGSAVGGLLDSVEDGVTGRLVPARDPEALAVAIGGLLADPVMRQRYGDAARRRALEQFAWGTVAARTLDAYHEATHPALKEAMA